MNTRKRTKLRYEKRDRLEAHRTLYGWQERFGISYENLKHAVDLTQKEKKEMRAFYKKYGI